MIPHGHVDTFTVDLVSGWAWDPVRPDEPVDVAIVDGDEVITTIRADGFRADLKEAGIGNGHHAFSATDLKSLVPWSRWNLAVVRQPDGAVIGNADRSLIATTSPHLLLQRHGCNAMLAFGDGAYRIAGATRLSDMAAYLPISVAETTDDPLPVLGEAMWELRGGHPTLILARFDRVGQPLRIDVPDDEIPHVRVCRGRVAGSNLLKSEVSLEVENVAGLHMTCVLEPRPDAPPRRLRVIGAAGVDHQFELPRGPDVPITFGVSHPGRHRIYMVMEPCIAAGENDRIRLSALDAIARTPVAKPAFGGF